MRFISDYFDLIHEFLDSGGPVLHAIFYVSVALWVLIVERFWFVCVVFPREKEKMVADWGRVMKNYSARQVGLVREKLVGRCGSRLLKNTDLMNTLLVVCPMLGLLGTVTGMISLFEVMALKGTGSPRLMASGISKATLPTMAGMASAIVGLFFSNQLKSMVGNRKNDFRGKLLEKGVAES